MLYSITSYNVVISVLSMFIMLTKSVMYILHVFPPVLSGVIHAILVALYSVSIAYQAGSDKSDPDHPQSGAPWYITKSCSVTHNKNLVGYCQQAKAAFACTCAMLAVFLVYFGFALWSCFPSKAQQAEYAAEKSRNEDRYAQLEGAEGFKSFAYPVPHTPGFQGGLNPMTPRTLAFNTLGGTRDLPLRTQSSTPDASSSPTHALRSPRLPRSPLKSDYNQASVERTEEPVGTAMYFPPPPKTSTK